MSLEQTIKYNDYEFEYNTLKMNHNFVYDSAGILQYTEIKAIVTGVLYGDTDPDETNPYYTAEGGLAANTALIWSDDFLPSTSV